MTRIGWSDILAVVPPPTSTAMVRKWALYRARAFANVVIASPSGVERVGGTASNLSFL